MINSHGNAGHSLASATAMVRGFSSVYKLNSFEMKPLEITNCPTTDPSLILPSVNQISRKREASIGVPVQSRNVHEASTGRYVKKILLLTS